MARKASALGWDIPKDEKASSTQSDKFESVADKVLGAASDTPQRGGDRGGYENRSRGPPRDDNRGGYGGNRGESRGGYGGDRNDNRGESRGGDRSESRGGYGGESRGGYGGDRNDNRGGDRGGYGGESRGGDRGGYGGDRGESRGGYGGDRSESRGGDRGGYCGDRGESRGGYGGDRSESRGGDRGGYDGESRGGYGGSRDDRRDSRGPQNVNPPSTGLVVFGLPDTLNSMSFEDFLYDTFKDNMKFEAKVCEDRETRRCKGFGFITFNSVEEATEGRRKLEALGHLDGKSLRVDFSRGRRN